MIFEALVSDEDKGTSHVADAQIMARSCLKYARRNTLPPSILGEKENTTYLNRLVPFLRSVAFLMIRRQCIRIRPSTRLIHKNASLALMPFFIAVLVRTFVCQSDKFSLVWTAWKVRTTPTSETSE